MSELSQLVDAFDEARRAGKRMALATVVGVDGPAYRREGAKMIIEEGGQVTCMISGGCLEGEVAAIAEEMMETGIPAVHHFDLDEDVLWGLGIGCGGSIDVYIEPLGEDPLLPAWFDALRHETSAVLVSVIGDPAERSRENPDEGSDESRRRLLLAEGRSPLGSLGDPDLDGAALELASAKLTQMHPQAESRTLKSISGEPVTVFFDVVAPPPELVLFGAGHDAIPLAELALRLGLNVTVVDARSAFATAERFPGARIILSQPTQLGERVQLGPRSYAVVMNHHLERDRLCLRMALESPAPYVGVLGPRSRYDRLKAALADEGFVPDGGQESRVHSPIGLDLGAEPPEEVALSILGEVLAVHKGHGAGFLRGHDGRIHDQRSGPARLVTR